MSTYLINNFPDESIPLTSGRILGAILAVWDQIELVLEAKHISDRLQQINTEALQLFVRMRIVLGFTLLHHIRHRLYCCHSQCYITCAELMEGLVVCDVQTRRCGPLPDLTDKYQVLTVQTTA